MITDHDVKLKTPECLTCDMDELCQYVNAKFSANGKYYILECEGPGVPEILLKSTVDDRRKSCLIIQLCCTRWQTYCPLVEM